MPPSTRRGTIRTGAPHIWQGASLLALLALLMLGRYSRTDAAPASVGAASLVPSGVRCVSDRREQQVGGDLPRVVVEVGPPETR